MDEDICDDSEGDADRDDRFVGNEDDEYYGYYDDLIDDDDDGEPPPDYADDALGPEDGEGDGDEMYLLGFVAL